MRHIAEGCDLAQQTCHFMQRDGARPHFEYVLDHSVLRSGDELRLDIITSVIAVLLQGREKLRVAVDIVYIFVEGKVCPELLAGEDSRAAFFAIQRSADCVVEENEVLEYLLCVGHIGDRLLEIARLESVEQHDDDVLVFGELEHTLISGHIMVFALWERGRECQSA